MSRWYPCIYCTEDLHCTKYSDDDYESWCVLGPCTAETPSNGDKIRRMTDEEIAEMMSPNESGCQPAMRGGVDCSGQISCYRCWLDWLKQEVSE